jgi:hypothetical protein
MKFAGNISQGEELRLEHSKGDPTIFSKFFCQEGKIFLLQISTIHAILRLVYPYNFVFQNFEILLSPI